MRRRRARAQGATRFCMGAAWRDVAGRRRSSTACSTWCAASAALGMEACCTLGMLTQRAGRRAGRGRADRLQPQPRHLARVLRQHHHHAHLRRAPRHARARAPGRHHGLLRRHHRHGRRPARRATACCSSSRRSIRIPKACRSTCWSASKARRSAIAPAEDPLELVRTIATARILMPASFVRLSAGRLSLTDEAQALCFLAGANSVFLGDRLLTTPNPGADARRAAVRQSSACGSTAPATSATAHVGRIVRSSGASRAPPCATLASGRPAAHARAARPASISRRTTTSALAGIRASTRRSTAAVARDGVRQHRLAAAARRARASSRDVERRFAAFKGTERSLYFSSGYLANIAVLTTLPERGDVIFSDERNHASLIDGIRLSARRRASCFRTTTSAALARAASRAVRAGSQRVRRRRVAVQHGRRRARRWRSTPRCVERPAPR